MTAAPVRLDDTTLGAARGRRAFKHSVPGVRQSAVFGGFPTLVFKRFHGADTVRVAGCHRDLCGFHVFLYGRQLPVEPTVSDGLTGKFTRPLR